jgi:flagellar biosynthesis/type III secretory pathway protein FliH
MDDKKSLENAIRNEAEQQILAIAHKEAEEIKRLDDAYASGLEEFSNSIKAQTDARIRQESSKIENRATLDLKKLKIRSIEALTSRTVEEAMQTIRHNPNYKKFLLDAVVDAVGRILTGAEIRLKADDLLFKDEIMDVLKASGVKGEIVILEDSRIKWGGCIIVDVSGGRIFDSTIERIYFRKSLLIRREAMRQLGISPEEAAKERSCKIQ